MTNLVRQETPVEYFRELVEDALAHQHVEANQLTAHYVVNMLAGFARVNPDARLDDEPLALGVVRALESAGWQRRAWLKWIGDRSLFLSGFFGDSLKQRLVDPDYYEALGGFAYGALSRGDHEAANPIFRELAAKFVAFVDVLSEVSQRSAMSTNRDALRLYERWLRTGSARTGSLLVELGFNPAASVASGRIH